MSCYIKLNGWSGSDRESAATQLAKVFRMPEYEVDSILDQLSEGTPWQFEHSISETQSGPAKNHLAKQGFEVAIVSESGEEEIESLEDESYDSGAAEGGQEISQAAKPKPKSQKGAIAVLVLVLLAGGWTQTEQGKEQLIRWGVITPLSSYKAPSLAESTYENPAYRDTHKGLTGIPYDDKTQHQVSSFMGSCLEPEENLATTLLLGDLKKTQSEFHCKGETIANPIGDWKCGYHYEKGCGRYTQTYYNCNRQYVCIPETAAFNRELFKKQLLALEQQMASR